MSDLPESPTFRTHFLVEAVSSSGSDSLAARAAWVARPGVPDERDEPARRLGLFRSCMPLHHNTVFEHAFLTVYAHLPGVVWWQLTRHRFMSMDTEDFCLAGDSRITVARREPDGSPALRHVPIAELYRNRHIGRPWGISTNPDAGLTHLPNGKWRVSLRGAATDGGSGHVGVYRTKDEARAARAVAVAAVGGVNHRRLIRDRSVTLRVLNETTNLFEFGEMADVFQRGVQQLLSVETECGHRLRCTRNHRLLTLDGWKKAGDLSATDRLAVVGRRSIHPDRAIPKRLRQGIGLWATQQRSRLIRDVDSCHVCGRTHPRDELILDHVVPVASCLRLALDESNLKPICDPCNRIKVAGEQKLARRANVAGSKFVKLVSRPSVVAEEMTYDIEMKGPWHNFVADGFVVHNSFNLESGRYKHLAPVFYLPPADRPCAEPEGFRPMRPRLEADADAVARLRDAIHDQACSAWGSYRAMVGAGVAREVARLVLPNWALFCAGYVSARASTWLQFFAKRRRADATTVATFPQWEIEQFARRCEDDCFKPLWPEQHAAFEACGRVAP